METPRCRREMVLRMYFSTPAPKADPAVERFSAQLAMLGVPECLPLEAKDALIKLRKSLGIEGESGAMVRSAATQDETSLVARCPTPFRSAFSMEATGPRADTPSLGELTSTGRQSVGSATAHSADAPQVSVAIRDANPFALALVEKQDQRAEAEKVHSSTQERKADEKPKAVWVVHTTPDRSAKTRSLRSESLQHGSQDVDSGETMAAERDQVESSSSQSNESSSSQSTGLLQPFGAERAAPLPAQAAQVSKLSVCQLKAVLKSAGVSHAGAVDKEDLVRIVTRLRAHADASSQSATPEGVSVAEDTACDRHDDTTLCASVAESRVSNRCTICYEATFQAHTLVCEHGPYCSRCMVRHARARWEMGSASVPCPQCMRPLAEHELGGLLPEELMGRFHSRSLDRAVSASRDLKSCPTPDCPMLVALEEDDLPLLQCPICDLESCVLCGAQPYHTDLTCEEHARRSRSSRVQKEQRAEKSFLKWMQKTGTKQCPTCSAPVSKQNLDKQTTQRAECHKMMCRACSTRFCFKCTKVLTSTFTCRCSIDDHGFVDPHTGQRVEHLDASETQAAKRRKR